MNKKITTEQVLSRGVAEILPSKKSLAELMEKKRIRLFLGIDPTGPLLTLGHSVVLRKLQQFTSLDHEVILLIGNGTVKIGDPTGRNSDRPMLTEEEIEDNFKNWQSQASKVLDFTKIKVVRNGDWLDKLTYVDMVKLMAKVTVQQLMERDMFQERLKKGQPIHAHEIMYPLMQGYDSVAMDVDLEIGGTDQTFNMMMGRTLQKSYNNRDKWVLTTPIINGTDGRKMSKSYGNFIALTEEPNDMYGKLMSISDEMITDYFTVLTDVSMEEIDEMSSAINSGENPMSFKKKLALNITKMYHDASKAEVAQDHFQNTVQDKSWEGGTPSSPIGETEDNIINILKKCHTQRSRNDLRRLLDQGGITLLFKDGSEERAKDKDRVYEIRTLHKVRVGKREIHTITTV